jgi:hypothetical protein
VHVAYTVASHEDYSYNQENAQWQKIFLTYNVVGVYANRLKSVMNVLRLCSVAPACVSTRNKITNPRCMSGTEDTLFLLFIPQYFFESLTSEGTRSQGRTLRVVSSPGAKGDRTAAR